MFFQLVFDDLISLGVRQFEFFVRVVIQLKNVFVLLFCCRCFLVHYVRTSFFWSPNLDLLIALHIIEMWVSSLGTCIF